MKNLSIATKLALTIGVAVTAGALMVAILLAQLGSVTEANDRLLAGEVHQIDAARVIQVDFKKQAQEWKNVLLRGKNPGDLQKHSAAFLALGAEVQERSKALIREITNPSIREHMAAFAAKHQEMGASYRAALDAFVASADKDPVAGDKMVRGTGQDKAATDSIDEIVNEFNRLIHQLVVDEEQHVTAQRRSIVLISLVVLVVVLTFSIIIARDIIGAQRSIVLGIEAVATGDLTVRLDDPRRDEMGKIVMALSAFIESLRTRVSTIGDNALQLATASEELSATAREMSTASEETAQQTTAAQSTVSEMGTNLESVLSSSAQMAEAIRDISVSAQQSCQVATEAKTVVDDADRTIKRLDASSSEIGEVVKLIASITSQTNLLALNATIEAARAGEAGRGFAIVAREVKDLAAETAKATEGIDQKIRAIQTDTAHAVGAIAAVKKVIDDVNSFSSTIAAAVEEHTSITTEVRRTLTWVGEGSVKLSSNVTSVGRAAESTAEGARSTKGAAASIAEMAAQMRDLVNQFRLSDRDGRVGAPSGEPAGQQAPSAARRNVAGPGQLARRARAA